MKKYILLFIIVILFKNITAQNLTYIGIEGGYKSDMYSQIDPFGGLRNTGSFGGNLSFVFGQEIQKSIFFETGITFHEYSENIAFKDDYGNFMSNALMSIQIPVRLKTSINLLNNKLLLTPYSGFKLCRNLDYFENSSDFNGSGGGSTTNFDDNHFEYEYKENSNIRKNFLLLETGLSLEYQTKKRMIIGLSAAWNHGFLPIIYQEVTYSINYSPNYQAYKQSNGDYLNITASIKLPISNIWHNKEIRKAQKPEKTQKIREYSELPFYMNFNAGIVRNLYSSTGEYFSPFGKKYDNFSNMSEFKADLIFGYNILEFLSLETGISAQNFMNTYHYENDTSFVGIGFGSGGFDFYSIPIRAMYRFKFLNNKLEVKPYAGFSMFIPAEGQGKYKTDDCIQGNFEWNDGNPYYTDISLISIAQAYHDKKMTVLGNAGLRLEYALTPKISVTGNADFALGFVDINRLHVEVIENGNTYEGEIYCNGTGYSLNAGLKYKIGKPN